MAEPTARRTEVVERTFDVFNRRDFDAWVADMHPEVEITPLRAALENTRYRGIEGARQFWRDVEDVWSEIRVDLHEMSAAGDRVLVLARLAGRGIGSSAPVELEMGFVLRFEGDKVIEAITYSSPGDARAAMASVGSS